jgi:DNA uptake protein ComE-like DNA-binding protein
MKQSFFNSFLQFTKAQQSGIFVLLVLALLMQTSRYFLDFRASEPAGKSKRQWVATPINRDTLQEQVFQRKYKLRPFNPNFISDFKGYQLGMSVKEIDRLLEYRKSNRYVNSAQEFQQVTKVSDSLLRKVAPFFKFPAWTASKGFQKVKYEFRKTPEKVVQIDINQATVEDLKKVYGIGDALSQRILKEKAKFGVFLSMDQLNDVYGLSPEVVEKLKERFIVDPKTTCQKININKATIKELMQLPYFKYPVAKKIVVYRSMNGPFTNLEDLTKISGLPIEKIGIIALYLDF